MISLRVDRSCLLRHHTTLRIPQLRNRRGRDGVELTAIFPSLSRRLSLWRRGAWRCSMKTRTCLAPRRSIATPWFCAVRPLLFSFIIYCQCWIRCDGRENLEIDRPPEEVVDLCIVGFVRLQDARMVHKFLAV